MLLHFHEYLGCHSTVDWSHLSNSWNIKIIKKLQHITTQQNAVTSYANKIIKMNEKLSSKIITHCPDAAA
jgi:hypothetical protein